jgi:hypothetical protein
MACRKNFEVKKKKDSSSSCDFFPRGENNKKSHGWNGNTQTCDGPTHLITITMHLVPSKSVRAEGVNFLAPFFFPVARRFKKLNTKETADDLGRFC